MGKKRNEKLTDLSFSSVLCQRSGIYTVVAPRVLRPNSDYQVAVSIHDTPEPVFVTVEIEGIQDAGGRIHSRKQQQVDSGETRILLFPVSLPTRSRCQIGSFMWDAVMTRLCPYLTRPRGSVLCLWCTGLDHLILNCENMHES